MPDLTKFGIAPEPEAVPAEDDASLAEGAAEPAAAPRGFRWTVPPGSKQPTTTGHPVLDQALLARSEANGRLRALRPALRRQQDKLADITAFMRRAETTDTLSSTEPGNVEAE